MLLPTPAAAPTSPPKTYTARRALRGGVLTVAGRICGLSIAFLVNAALARFLTRPEYGAFLLILSTIGLLATFGRFGLDRTMIRLVVESRVVGNLVRARRALGLGWRLATMTTAATALAATLVLGMLGNSTRLVESLLPQGTGLALVLAIGVGVAALSFLNLAAESLRGFHELRFATLFDGRPNGPLTNLVFLFLCTAVAALVGLSLVLAVRLYVISLGIVLALAGWCLWRTAREALVPRAGDAPPAGGAPAAGGETLGYSHVLAICVPLCLAQVLAVVVANADVWIAGSCVSADDLALFGAARHLTSIVAVPIYMANLAVVSFVPELHAQGRLHELERLMQSASAAATAPSIVVLAVIAIWPASVLSLVFGPSFREGASALVILSLGQFLVTWTGGCQTCLAMTGHQKAQLRVMVLATIALVASGTFAAQRWGIMGLATASSIVLAASNLAQWLLARKLVGVWTHARIPVGRRGVADE